MNKNGKVAVVGLGEVGRPILELFSNHYDVIGVDVERAERCDPVEFLHICYPFEIEDFIGETAKYIDLFRPTLTLINSTVAIGTTRAIADRTGAAVVNSPVRGKHARMLDELRTYTKFVGPMDIGSGENAARHFESAGVTTKVLASPEATELAKLTETTYFGLLIAWAQEVERYCDRAGQNYHDVISFYEEISYLPRVKFFAGTIGGHCVLPNIEILRKWHPSVILEAIRASNTMKVEKEACRDGEVISATGTHA
jgi:UDP-N-acetyl-D-mannosaminuronate dehydrogenase